MKVIRTTAADALLPNLDQTPTVGLVALPGAFGGVLLSSGSAGQACAVGALVLIALLLSQTRGVALMIELLARREVHRASSPHPLASPTRRLNRADPVRVDTRSHGDGWPPEVTHEWPERRASWRPI
jgi:putative ABC transport system permease protein